MIKVNGNKRGAKVKVKGNTSTILAEFSTLCKGIKEEGCLGFESEEDLKEALHYAVDMAFIPTETLLAEALEKLADSLKELSMKGKGEE